ncbi:MAG: hypothetical protein ACOH5I_04755 [Oligoflexus sp.]
MEEPKVKAQTSIWYAKRHWRIGFAILVVSLLLSAVHLSAGNLVQALMAANDLRLDPELDSLLDSNDFELQHKRSVQQHFSKFGIYIPTDDIIVNARDIVHEPYRSLLLQSCGSGKIFVWVPLKFRLPLIGEKIIEWCLVKK